MTEISIEYPYVVNILNDHDMIDKVTSLLKINLVSTWDKNLFL